LIRYQTEQQRFVALDSGAKTAARSTALALQQYRTGLVTYTSVLQAQSTQLTAEDNLAQSRAALTSDLVSLYKALGGGWKEGDFVETPPATDQIFRQ
jgi:multidrug efflux system outer membrane protein